MELPLHPAQVALSKALNEGVEVIIFSVSGEANSWCYIRNGSKFERIFQQRQEAELKDIYDELSYWLRKHDANCHRDGKLLFVDFYRKIETNL